MRMNLDHVANGHFVLGRDVLCEFDYWPLAVSMPPTKVCPLPFTYQVSSSNYNTGTAAPRVCVLLCYRISSNSHCP